MRDANHYRQMFEQNTSTGIGFSLAASAVYAHRYGQCEAEHHATEEWRQIATDLQQRYGETLTAQQAIAEMDNTKAVNEPEISYSLGEEIDISQLAADNPCGLGLDQARAILDDVAAGGALDLWQAWRVHRFRASQQETGNTITLIYNECSQRAALCDGADSQWTDAESLQDALECYEHDRMSG